MIKLTVGPEEAAYSATSGAGALAIKLDGGASRYRADLLGAAAMVNAQWTLTAFQYQYLMAFYRSATARGSAPFLIDLILDNGALEEYTAHFMPGTLALVGRVGTAYIVGAQLEVLPQAEDAEYDSTVVEVYGLYGEDAAGVFDLLSHFINADLLEALG